MELQFFGANCLRISTRKAQIVVDDNLGQLGLKSITKPTDISLRTFSGAPTHDSHFGADMPGEYEVSGAVIHGVGARGHMETESHFGATIFTIRSDDITVAILGHIYPELSDEQVEQLGHIDVAVVPVGGNGYTLDGTGALKVIKQIEPKIIIPTHYADKAIKYEVPQAELADALKNMAMEPGETTDKLKLKSGEIGDTTKLVVLQRA